MAVSARSRVVTSIVPVGRQARRHGYATYRVKQGRSGASDHGCAARTRNRRSTTPLTPARSVRDEDLGARSEVRSAARLPSTVEVDILADGVEAGARLARQSLSLEVPLTVCARPHRDLLGCRSTARTAGWSTRRQVFGAGCSSSIAPGRSLARDGTAEMDTRTLSVPTRAIRRYRKRSWFMSDRTAVRPSSRADTYPSVTLPQVTRTRVEVIY